MEMGVAEASVLPVAQYLMPGITSSEAPGAQIDVARSASIGLRSTHSQTHQEQTEWPEINGKVYVKKKEAAKNIQNCFPG